MMISQICLIIMILKICLIIMIRQICLIIMICQKITMTNKIIMIDNIISVFDLNILYTFIIIIKCYYLSNKVMYYIINI